MPAEALRYKGGDDPQTAADRAANRYIVEELRRRFPQDGILAEESPEEWRGARHERVWMVDPLDGTKEFLERNGEFVVQIGLTIAGRPTLGVIYQPTEDRLFSGVVGDGAWLEVGRKRVPLRTSERREPEEFVAVLSRSHGSRLADRMAEVLGVRRVVRIGSAGLKVGAIAEGKADLYLQPNSFTRLWDSAAPEALLVAAGGAVSDMLGRPLDYQGQETHNLFGFLASNGRIHEQIVEVVAPLWEQERRGPS